MPRGPEVVSSASKLFELTLSFRMAPSKGPVKLIQRVEKAHSFSQFVSNLFQFIIKTIKEAEK